MISLGHRFSLIFALKNVLNFESCFSAKVSTMFASPIFTMTLKHISLTQDSHFIIVFSILVLYAFYDKNNTISKV